MSKPLPIKTGTWELIRFRPFYFNLGLWLGALFIISRLLPAWLKKNYYDQLIVDGNGRFPHTTPRVTRPI